MKLAIAATLFASAAAFSPATKAAFNTQLNVSSDYLSAVQTGPASFAQPQAAPLASAGNVNTIGNRKTVLNQATGPYTSEAKKLWDETNQLLIQGSTLRTWSYPNPAVERVNVILGSNGRPFDADVELWQGPDNTPVKCRVYSEDGTIRPFNTIIETPRGPNTISVRNIGQIELPILACVSTQVGNASAALAASGKGKTVQGGAIQTYPFDPTIDSIEVQIKTDGRPLNCRIELLNGPNNIKQVAEIYTEDGMDRPFYMQLQTPGSGNVVRIQNTSPVEFPMTVTVEAKDVNSYSSQEEVVLGGDSGW
jgi:hypothetical protein